MANKDSRTPAMSTALWKIADKLKGIADIIEHITLVSIMGVAAGTVVYFLFFQWLSYQPYLDFRRYLPALLSVIGFMYAIYKAVPILEDFWGLKRSRINTSHPFCVYVAIFLWLVFINSIVIAFGYQIESGVAFHVMLENFFGRYGNDTPHYIAIAQRWYENTLCDHRVNIVFFPFYSILIRVVYFFTPSYMFAAYVLSNFFALASGIMFYKLVVAITSSDEARLAVKFLYILPSAFFFFVPLTESLFLFLSVAVMYYALKGKYLWVFVFGLMASLTRSVGVLLVVPVACELISKLRQDVKPVEIETHHRINGQIWRKFLCLLAFPLGIGIYLLINHMVYGSATQFMVIQREHWFQSMYYFWNTITYLTNQISTASTSWVIGISIPGVIAFWLSLTLIIYGATKIRVSLTLYAMAYFVFAFGPTWLMSGPRYVAVLFPIALAAAKIASIKKSYNLMLTIAYISMFILYFHEFVRDNFVF